MSRAAGKRVAFAVNGSNDDDGALFSKQPSPKYRRLSSPDIILKPINTLLGNDGVFSAIDKGHISGDTRRAYLLMNAFNVVAEDPIWQKILNLEFQKLKTCKKAIASGQPFKKEGDKRLADVLDDCIKTGDWEPLFEEGGLLRKDRSFESLSASSSDKSMHAQPMNLMSEMNYFRDAFKQNYVALYPDLLISTMDRYALSANYYNRSMTIIQSSGMGKSRLVDHTAKHRFTFPLNLHSDLPSGHNTYPPFDRNVRDYLTTPFKEETPGLIRHFAFLEALFRQAVVELKEYEKGDLADIAYKWYKWMNHDSTPMTVGTNRSNFYNRVIEHAKKLETSKPEPQGMNITECRSVYLEQAAKAFTDCLAKFHGATADSILAIVYMDEAHILQEVGSKRRNPYFALMRVLNSLVKSRIFFLFLSTNSSLSDFAPPTTNADLPSLRVKAGSELIPPFFELPQDSFLDIPGEAIQAEVTLNGVCKLEHIVKLGRPMWYSYYQSLPDSDKNNTMDLALTKMDIKSDPVKATRAKIANLDCRVLLKYDPIHPNAIRTQAELVRSHMRVIFNIPESRHYTWSGYPSEPILAEAAAQLLNGSDNIAEDASAILKSALESCLLADDERGELVARTLFTVAHDLATAKLYPKPWPPAPLPYHRPIPVLTLLEALCAPECWQVVRSARPFHAFPGDVTLEEAFQGAWVNFAHFAQLSDHESFDLKFFTTLLKRGAAAQTFTDQPSWDFGIPIHFGDPDTPICEANTTGLLGRVKTKDVDTDPMEVGSNERNLPILSMTLHLGVENDTGDRVVIRSTDQNSNTAAGNTHSSERATQSSANTGAGFPADIHRRNYVVTLYGCTTKTYGCIPAGSNVYSTLLQTPTPSKDFPRAKWEKNKANFHRTNFSLGKE